MARSAALGILALGLAGAAGAQSRAVADGVTWEGTASGPVDVYRGIPYALAPVGLRRWQAPVPVPRGTGNRSAREAGPDCIQSNRLDAFTMGIAAVFGTRDRVVPDPPRPAEDCLYLNVWTPVRDARTVPVMVWIHGGSNLSGSGSQQLYDGRALAERGVVVVTINYRLGFLGFFSHRALTAEAGTGPADNFGLLDQLEALRWVQRNIRSFGGDPARVTVFGESAGASDIVHLLVSPRSRGLFHRAIAQSGAPLLPLRTRAEAEAVGDQLARLAGADTAADPLARLRRLSPDSLLRLQDRLLLSGAAPAPAVDGWLFDRHPGRMLEDGTLPPVPVLVGSNAREMTTLRYYLPRVAPTAEGFRGWLDQVFGTTAGVLASRYAGTAPAEALIDAVTDLYFTCPARLVARAVERTGQPAYLYQFTRVVPGGESLGAFHAAELGYVFGNQPAWHPWQPADRELSGAMMDYWVRFASTGNPTTSLRTPWPPIGPDGRDRYLELDAQPVLRTGFAADRCDAMDQAIRAGWR